MKTNNLLNLCEKELEKSYIKNKYAAVLLYRNKVVSIGHNQLKSTVPRDKSKCVLRT